MTVAHPTAHSVKRLSGSCASLAAMLKCIRPMPRYAVGQLLRSIPSTRNLGTLGLIISRIYRSPHTGISRVPWTNLSILPSITSWTRETGKTPLFASESLVKSDGGGLSDFATGPSPFPDTPWQEAQDRRNSFRPGFSSGCACRTSIVPIIAEAAIKITHHVVRMSLCPFVFARSNRARALPRNTNPARRLLSVQPLQDRRLNSKLPRAHAFCGASARGCAAASR